MKQIKKKVGINKHFLIIIFFLRNHKSTKPTSWIYRTVYFHSEPEAAITHVRFNKTAFASIENSKIHMKWEIT